MIDGIENATGDKEVMDLLTDDLDVLCGLVQQGDIRVPQLNLSNEEGELLSSIILREHSDEESYRNALLEAAMFIPAIEAKACALYYMTSNGGYGIIKFTKKLVAGGFVTPEGEPETLQTIDPARIDTETVVVLDKFMKCKADSTYAKQTFDILTRRGHHIDMFIELNSLRSTLIF